MAIDTTISNASLYVDSGRESTDRTCESAGRLVVAISLGCIVMSYLVRLPAIVEPLGIDQGIFATIAWALRRGLALYRDVWDQKPPGIDLVYLFGFRVMGETATAVFWMDFLASTLTCAMVASIARITSGARAGWMAAALYAVGTVPAYALRFGGFLERAVPETFTPVCVAGSLLLLLGASRTKLTSLLLSGALLGFAALLKPTALVPGVALALWCVWDVPGREKLRSGLILCAGIASIVGAAVVWLVSHGVLRDAWIAVVEYNRSYVAIGWSWRGAIVECARDIWLRVRSEPLWLVGSVALAADVWIWATARRNGPHVMRAIWAACIGAGILANGVRFFNSYFLPLSVPLALAGAALIDRAVRGGRASRVALCALGLVAAFLVFRYGHLARFAEATTADLTQRLAHNGPAPHAAYLERFGGYNNGRGFSARANAELADYIRHHTSSPDTIYIVGMAPEVYFAADRRPANRFIWSSPVTFKLFDHTDFTLERLVGDLRASAPELLILEHNTRDSLQGKSGDDVLQSAAVRALLTAYRFEIRIEDFEIHRRHR